MEAVDGLGILKKAILETNKNFKLTYLDSNGYPNTVTMGFSHLNKSLSIVLMFKKDSDIIPILESNPWVQLFYQTRDLKYSVKLIGEVIVSTAAVSGKKLISAYPFLADYFAPDGEDAALVQLQTEGIEIDTREESWIIQKSEKFVLKSGSLEKVDEFDFLNVPLSAGQHANIGFDDIRRRITKNHGDMLMNFMQEEMEQYISYFSEGFSATGDLDVQGHVAKLKSDLSSVDFSSAEINWGLRDFEKLKENIVKCKSFLDINQGDDSVVSLHQEEIWQNVKGDWKILQIKDV